MIRVILLNLLLLFLPLILYFAYTGIMRQVRPSDEPVPDAPLVWLVVIGAVLMIVGLITFGNWEDTPKDGQYIPAHMKDGKLVPGRVE